MQSVASVAAKPVLSDFGDGWNMKQETVAARITPRTRAIIVVRIFGRKGAWCNGNFRLTRVHSNSSASQ